VTDLGSANVSAALFGNSHMAVIVADLSQRTTWPVTTRQIAASTGLADSLVRAVLLRLVAAGALTPLPKMEGSRGRQFFDRAHPTWWSTFTALACSVASPLPVTQSEARGRTDLSDSDSSGGTGLYQRPNSTFNSQTPGAL
jgi:hypothetical protein